MIDRIRRLLRLRAARRRIRMKPFTPAMLPPRPPAPTVEEEAAEGLLLAEYACRMAVKNQLITWALGDGEPFDLDRLKGIVRERLRALAEEAEGAADRATATRESAAGRMGTSSHQHDYRRDDADNLERRAAVNRAVALRLLHASDDDDALTALAESSRADAWDDVGQGIRDRLGRAAAPRPILTAEERAERQQTVVALDLAALAEERGVVL